VRAGLSRPLRAYPWLCALVPTCDRTPCHAWVSRSCATRWSVPDRVPVGSAALKPRSCRIGRFHDCSFVSPGAAPLLCRPTDAGGTLHPWQRHSTTHPTSRVLRSPSVGHWCV